MVALQCCISFYCIKGVLNTGKEEYVQPSNTGSLSAALQYRFLIPKSPIQVPYLQIWKVDSTSPLLYICQFICPFWNLAEGWECPGTNPSWILRMIVYKECACCSGKN